MKTSIRKAFSDDYNGLCELFDELDALHRDNLPHRFQKPDGPARDEGYYSGLIADENIGFFVAEANGKLVGFVHVIVSETPSFPIFIPHRFGIVDSLLVTSEFQKQGIGKMLMDKAEEWAMAKGAAYIELNVYEFNQAAISFYESSGYQMYSRRMSKELKADKSND